MIGDYSADVNKLMGFVEAERWAEMAEWLLQRIHALHRTGAEFAVIASNTPHIVFDEVQSKSPIPLLSIVEQTLIKAQEMGVKNVGLMGTKLTMESDFYKTPFLSNNISVTVPSEKDQQFIHKKLFSEIELGIFTDATREALLVIAKKMVAEKQIDALILGCTELPLILTESKYGIPFINASAIHCESIIAYCLSA